MTTCTTCGRGIGYARYNNAADASPMAQPIIDNVAFYFDVEPSDLLGPSREKYLAYARHIATYLLVETTDLNLNQVGTFMGGRDHSTVLHSQQKIAKLMKTPQVAGDVRNCARMVLEGAAA